MTRRLAHGIAIALLLPWLVALRPLHQHGPALPVASAACHDHSGGGPLTPESRDSADDCPVCHIVLTVTDATLPAVVSRPADPVGMVQLPPAAAPAAGVPFIARAPRAPPA